ncbi:DEAD/DEAH box helicase [Halalkalicoccus ordinarius]|uniref:DEAD/DEAH box helicase n=1 Tax=Halalkalicoccus ordinarius TaxID=3116651 RepID=UPI00300E7002
MTETDRSIDEFYDALQALGHPVVTAEEVARALECTQEEADRWLSELTDAGRVGRRDVERDPVVWYPVDWNRQVSREHVVAFPDRRELVVEHPDQFTRARLSQFAYLVDTSGSGGYLYRIREEDVWGAPYDDLGELLSAMRAVLGERHPGLEEWVERQWKRARQFVLRTHEDGYTVLEADSASLMGNVARRLLDEDQLHAPISDTESWVVEGSEAEIKRLLYDEGYPVRDDRDLDPGDPLEIALGLELRDYQREWVERFTEQKAGVLVGPPGSGKTVAGMGAMAAVGGETLILVPSRELAAQWRESLLANTSLGEEQIGEYHGGEKEVRPVTIATYQTAGMDRHRRLFDERRWGLIVYDEAHHIPSPVFRRSADLQSKHRLGLSATPVRESDDEAEIFTLIGPPIGTDWSALFDAGYVVEPEVEIRYVPWGSDEAESEYASTTGHERRQTAASNPGKLPEIRRLLSEHDEEKTLVFVDWLEQGKRYEEALSVPFLSGETRYARRERLLSEFRHGARDTLIVSRVGDEGIDLPDASLAIVASGLGGSRRQGAQRAGRTMRPVGGARMYVLATRGTEEEEFARRQVRHLQSKGIHVMESDVDANANADGESS